MPIPALPSLLRHFSPAKRWLWGLLWATLLPGCHPQTDPGTATTPPVGHYEGAISAPGRPELRAALDIRHPRPGHYDAEFTVPGSTLSFVADTVIFANRRLHLQRPGRPGQTLALALDGDFWRGTLVLDSLAVSAILVKRGEPTPSTYRVAAAPQAGGPAWLFVPSDTRTPGPALALLPDAETAPAAALWADALAREGVIVLVLPAADSADAATEGLRWQAAAERLRNTPGADTANVGAWAAGNRAGALAQALAAGPARRPAFLIAQNAGVNPAIRAAFRELKARKMPLLGLYGGAATGTQAAALRNALGGRRGALVRTYRAASPALLVPGGLSPRFSPGLPEEVAAWLRSR